jgi:hypothetical protein
MRGRLDRSLELTSIDMIQENRQRQIDSSVLVTGLSCRKIHLKEGAVDVHV